MRSKLLYLSLNLANFSEVFGRRGNIPPCMSVRSYINLCTNPYAVLSVQLLHCCQIKHPYTQVKWGRSLVISDKLMSKLCGCFNVLSRTKLRDTHNLFMFRIKRYENVR